MADYDSLADLVVSRADAMSSAPGSNGRPAGAMAAIVGPGAAAVRVGGAGRQVWVANVNAPDQVVITGEASAVADECERLRLVWCCSGGAPEPISLGEE